MSTLTRRHFIQLMGASTLISSPLLRAAVPKRKIGVALLGLGGYSTGLLAPALQSTKHCELRGIITGSPEKVPQWQQKYGIPDTNVYSYATMAEIANNPDIDVIYVVTPTATHKDFAVRAANTGKHVWCEKPMAMNEAECQAIINACRKNNVMLSIGYRMQHEPNTRRLAGYAATSPYGKITGLESFAGYGGNGLPPDNWRMQKAMGGGALYDMGVYAINGARFITRREPIAVTGEVFMDHPAFNEVDNTTLFTMDFGDGLMADCGTSVVESFNRLKTTCENGSYQLKPMQSYSGVEATTSDGRHFPAIKGMQQTLQMDNDALAILGRGPALVSAEDGMRDIRIVNAIRKAAETGKTVTL
ncbi:Gfo/Idh/MocA family protein [Alteromonas gilva]|uniref:Gfo/Idh/MocA family oxidoreductase n=1 Tax=Alteromonas gilva TaxID=2987522 RepID=A0ABT5L404_9ALTE|nr:Gfo/Idh/MocA family oxidoreductase [Alteromonas gilva]MDC8831126.1 Gfo/Idh/MocA family oxidoreductase [Alteromonas gilva]